MKIQTRNSGGLHQWCQSRWKDMSGFRLHFGVTNTEIYVRMRVWGGREKGKVKGLCSLFYFWIKLREEPPLRFEHNILRCFRHQIEALNNQGNLQILKVLRDSSFLFMRFRYVKWEHLNHFIKNEKLKEIVVTFR